MYLWRQSQLYISCMIIFQLLGHLPFFLISSNPELLHGGPGKNLRHEADLRTCACCVIGELQALVRLAIGSGNVHNFRFSENSLIEVLQVLATLALAFWTIFLYLAIIGIRWIHGLFFLYDSQDVKLIIVIIVE